MQVPALYRVVVIPAGRRRYLELLFAHLEAQKADFDELQVWLNTTDQTDIAFCEAFAKGRAWVALLYSEIPVVDPIPFSIFQFFQYCAKPDSVYLRLDDDIVYLEPGFIAKIFAFRIQFPQFFLVYGNNVNNAITSHLQQRFGNLPFSPLVGYACMDPVGWGRGDFAEDLHTRFLAAIEDGSTDAWRFRPWILGYYERVSINSISWLGAEFEKFSGVVDRDEEQWLSVEKPKMLGKPNIIFGDALCAHYAFHTQRVYLDATDVLSRYRRLLPDSSAGPK
jgi:hypothetical protein